MLLEASIPWSSLGDKAPGDTSSIRLFLDLKHSSSIRDLSSSAAGRYLDPLSEIISFSNDLHPANLQKASKKLLAVRSWTISK